MLSYSESHMAFVVMLHVLTVFSSASPSAELIVCERYIQILPSLNRNRSLFPVLNMKFLHGQGGINFIANFYSQSTNIHDCGNVQDIFRREKITASITGLHDP